MITAGDLESRHKGEVVTLTHGDMTITGRIESIRHYTKEVPVLFTSAKVRAGYSAPFYLNNKPKSFTSVEFTNGLVFEVRSESSAKMDYSI